MSLVKYKGYAAKVEYSAEDQLLVGVVIGIKDVLSFHAEAAADVDKAFHSTIDDYLAACSKRGIKPAKPFSGEFRYRPGKARHERLAVFAATEDVSNNDIVNRAIDEYLGKRDPAA